MLKLALVGVASAFNAGLTASMDFSVAKQAKDVYFEEIVKIIN